MHNKVQDHPPPKGNCYMPARIQNALKLLSLAALLPTQAVGAQTVSVECFSRGAVTAVSTCSDTVDASGPLQFKQIKFRVLDASGKAMSDAMVHFYATSGKVAPDSSLTNKDGYVFATWSRDSNLATPAMISMTFSSPSSGGWQSQFGITIPQKALKYGIRMDRETDQQTGFEKAPLPHSIYVRLVQFDTGTAKPPVPVSDRTKCPEYSVAFTQMGKGSMSPDTTVMWYDDDKEECRAYGNWTLGDGAGIRDAKAKLVGASVSIPNSIVEFESYARALPRIVGGFALSHYSGYMGVKKGSKVTATVERTVDNVKITSDTVLWSTRDTLSRVESEWKPAAIVGVSAPLIPKVYRLSATAGVDLNSPTTDWYFGFSAVRVFGKLTSEALPVDAHILFHVGRNDVVEDESNCTTQGDCRTKRKTRFHGMAGMISVDATSLITDVLKKIGI
jgi:hypothetical protein